MALVGLFDNIVINSKNKKDIKELIEEIENGEADDDEIDKILKSENVGIDEKITIIHNKILSYLGKQKKNVVCITSKDDLHEYMNNAFESCRIAIDTETNNSLDPVTCKIMGLCLYYPGGKQAYIPINHRDKYTKTRLSWQLTEEDIAVELQRLTDSRVGWTSEYDEQTYTEYWIEHHYRNKEFVKSPLVIMHNGKFDYEVIKCACNVSLPVDWDTMICQRLMDENDLAGLKYLYTKYIDRTQEKYGLDSLYANNAYADSDPEIFALYAATDSMMTDKVFEQLQLDFMAQPEQKTFLHLFSFVEMPNVIVTAETELRGFKVDLEYGKHLGVKYNRLLAECDKQLEEAIKSLEPEVAKWRLTKEANDKTKQYMPAKSKLSIEKLEQRYPLKDTDGRRFKYGKTKSEQLASPLTPESLSSPIQLAILLYDILKAPVMDPKNNPRGTGAEFLEFMNETMKSPILDLMLERRHFSKMLTAYIENIPTLAQHWPDGRIRFHLNQLGTDTGRFSSGGKLGYMENYDTPFEKRVEVSGINIQNIPSSAYNMRCLFVGETTYNDYEDNNGIFEIPEYEEVETETGWKYPEKLTLDDILLSDETKFKIKSISFNSTNKKYIISI